jgi:hypothetical protein
MELGMFSQLRLAALSALRIIAKLTEDTRADKNLSS